MGWTAECAVQLTKARDELSGEYSALGHAKLIEGDAIKLTLQRSPWFLVARAEAESGVEASPWGGTRIRGKPEGDTIRLHRRVAGRTARLELRGPRGRAETLRVWEARFKAALDACLAGVD